MPGDEVRRLHLERTGAGHLLAKGLDKNLMETWIGEAHARWKNKDTVFSLMASWIAFNCYFGSYCEENNWVGFKRSCDNSGRDLDASRSRLDFLIEQEDFKSFFKSFSQEKVFEESIRLPIVRQDPDGKIRKKVPSDLEAGTYQWKNLTHRQTFDVLYQIRNNLFHGQKDHAHTGRDHEVIEAACSFMIPFLTKLITATQT